MAAVLDATKTEYPLTYNDHSIPHYEGQSLLPILTKDEERESPLFWEHESNAAVRIDDWKLFRKFPENWELYNISSDRTELHNIANKYPEKVSTMIKHYKAWAQRCGVIPREKY
jgi:arylsulfatase A-like enzyme